MSIARQCLKDKLCRKHLISALATEIKAEIQSLCSRETDSIQKNKNPASFKAFQWSSIVDEATKFAPTLVDILRLITTYWTRRKKAKRNSYIVIGLCICILCKHRNPSMALFQRIISLILYAGHSGKKVSYSTYRNFSNNYNNNCRCMRDFKSFTSACLTLIL